MIRIWGVGFEREEGGASAKFNAKMPMPGLGGHGVTGGSRSARCSKPWESEEMRLWKSYKMRKFESCIPI